MEATDWCYASGIVAVLETFLLTPDAIREAASADDLLTRVRRCPIYADLQLNGSDDPMRAAAALEQALITYVRRFARDCPTPHVADVLLIDYDFRDAGNYLKSVHCDIERQPVALSSLPDEGLAEALAAREPLADLAGRVARRAASGDAVRPDIVDLMADGAALAWMPELVRPLGSASVERWAAKRQRLAAIEAVLRARMAGVDAADLRDYIVSRLPNLPELGTLADAEADGFARALADLLPAEWLGGVDLASGARAVQELANRFDAELEATLEASRYDGFGAGRVFGYLWRLFRENRNLRAALGGFAGRIRPELVAQALRGVA